MSNSRTQRPRRLSPRQRAWASLACFAATTLFISTAPCRANAAGPEQAWVGRDIRLNVRSGEGQQFRIVSGVATGDAVKILSRSDRWTRIRLGDGKEGWIPAGYLQPEAPPTVRAAQLSDEVAELQASLTASRHESESLRSSNQELTTRDDSQRSEVERLTMENMDLRAGERWPYLIVGASIFVAGMLVGSILHSLSGRRQRPRVRL